MSVEPKVDLAGHNIKEWSLIILLMALAFVFVVFGIAFASAMIANPNIIVTGTIDLGQFTGVIIGVAMVAVVLVGQQLTSKQQADAVSATDKVWLDGEK
jgi:hypothetical protein